MAPAPAGAPSSRDEGATLPCPVCGQGFSPLGRARFCSDGCRKKAWRRRHQVPQVPVVVPAGAPRRPGTVYECGSCGTRAVGEQYCEGCGTFMARVGLGGPCPECGSAVAIEELVDMSLLAPALRGERKAKARKGGKP
jgi:hypothetical protein